jgi:hypothetical protein
VAQETRNLLLRLSPETELEWERVKKINGAATANECFRYLIRRLDFAVRARLDDEALPLYERGELDRKGWEQSALRYQRRKRAAAEQRVPA